MSKRAIYLDERERRLARVAFRYIKNEVGQAIEITGRRSLQTVSLKWLERDIASLLEKFAEPTEVEEARANG